MREGGEIYIKGDEYEKLMEYFELDDLKKVLDESYYADTGDMNVSTGALNGMVSAAWETDIPPFMRKRTLNTLTKKRRFVYWPGNDAEKEPEYRICHGFACICGYACF